MLLYILVGWLVGFGLAMALGSLLARKSRPDPDFTQEMRAAFVADHDDLASVMKKICRKHGYILVRRRWPRAHFMRSSDYWFAFWSMTVLPTFPFAGGFFIGAMLRGALLTIVDFSEA